MRQRFIERLKAYGCSKHAYGCFSLRCGVLNWSLTSLFLGIGLLLFVTIIDWKTQNIIHFSFSVQKEIRATLHFGRPPLTPVKEGNLEQSNKYDEEIEKLEQELELLGEQLDWWIKRVVWFYAFLCTIRGLIGCLGVGLRDPVLVKTLWHISIFSFFIDILICAAFPIAIQIQGVRLAWYFWLWLIAPLLYFPYIGWSTCEMIFSYQRVVDMGGTGTEFASALDLEALLLPDKRQSTNMYME